MLANLGISQSTVVTLDTEESERLTQMEMRRSHCGLFSVRVNPTTGGWKRHQHKCGQWRDHFCERCFQDRKDAVAGTLLRIEEGCTSPIAVRMMPSEAKVHTRAMRERGVEYKRYPVEDGSEIVIFDLDDYEYYGDTMATGEVDLDELTATPLHKRSSGHLGDAPPMIVSDDEDGEDQVIAVKVETVIAYAGEGMRLSDAWKAAMEATRDLNPAFDRDEIEAACQMRMDAYREAILAGGGTIRYVCRMNDTVSFKSYRGWIYSELNDESLIDMDLFWMRGRGIEPT